MVDLQAQCFKIRLDLRNQCQDPRVVRGNQVNFLTGNTSFVKCLLCCILVVGQVGCRLLVGRVCFGQEGLGFHSLTTKSSRNELLLVDGLEECATHLGLVEGGLLSVEHHEGVAVTRLGINVPVRSLELIRCICRNCFHDVDAATESSGKTRRIILEDAPLEGGCLCGDLAVVVFVGNSGDLSGRDVIELVGTRADRLGLQFVCAHA